MYRCFELAQKGAGYTAPNPMVGAVLVFDNKIIGEGYHAAYGQAHAEVNCINNVPAEKKVCISKSTLYVSLEPCTHFGKTPPCTDLIIAHKIPRVVTGCKDSFAAVNGKGIEKLQAAGIEVITGVLEHEATALNKRFFTFNNKQRPYIILKWAQSSNGKIADDTNERLHISNHICNSIVHTWRSHEAAILVGTKTALKDNPALTTRLVAGKNPLRLVIDRQLILPTSLKLFDGTAKTFVYNFWKTEAHEKVSYCKLNRYQSVSGQIVHHLFNNNIQSLIVEGGAKILQSFIDGGYWDEARIITNTTMQIEEGMQSPNLTGQLLTTKEIYESDTIEYFINSNNQ